eukprot:scaffold1261_cov184-Pinguiococcus_pyrenoidosus.AAC.1
MRCGAIRRGLQVAGRTERELREQHDRDVGETDFNSKVAVLLATSPAATHARQVMRRALAFNGHRSFPAPCGRDCVQLRFKRGGSR